MHQKYLDEVGGGRFPNREIEGHLSNLGNSETVLYN
jgi:hypothetical protein